MLHYCAKSSALQTPYLTRLWAYLTFTSVLGKRVRISDLDQAPTWCLAWFLFGIGGNALGISELAAVVGRRDSKFRKHYYATYIMDMGRGGHLDAHGNQQQNSKIVGQHSRVTSKCQLSTMKQSPTM